MHLAQQPYSAARLKLLRSLAVSRSVTCVQVTQLLGTGIFTESKDRVDLVLSLWQAIRDRGTNFFMVFQVEGMCNRGLL